MTTVSVIIPYFQKQSGILRRALTSLLQQKLPLNILIDVIIVDDGSPVPASAEIEGLNITTPFRLSLTQQPNGGAAGARNTALRLVGNETTYIAFLDSDDIWHSEHLATALDALGRGYDFYFCDARRQGENKSRFEEYPPFQAFLRSPASQLISEKLFALQPLPFFSQSLRTPAYCIPDVIYRRSIAPSLVFDTGLREVGEDSLFLLQLILRCRRICCSVRELVTFADGVNIWHSKLTWNDPGHLLRYIGMIQYHAKLLKEISLSAEDAKFVADRVRMYHRSFAFLAVRYFLKKRKFWPRDLVQLTRRDPRFWFWFPAWALYVSITYPLGLYDPFKSGDIYHPGTARAA